MLIAVKVYVNKRLNVNERNEYTDLPIFGCRLCDCVKSFDESNIKLRIHSFGKAKSWKKNIVKWTSQAILYHMMRLLYDVIVINRIILINMNPFIQLRSYTQLLMDWNQALIALEIKKIM